MFGLLKSMSLQMGTISTDDAQQVAEAVNRRLQELLNAELIRIYWKEEGDDGVILKPVTFINNTKEPDPRPFSLQRDANGLLSWAFHNKEPVWVEKIKSKNLENGIVNELTGASIEKEYLSYFRYRPDSMIVVPYIVDGDVDGLFVVELRRSDVFNRRVVDLLAEACRYIGPILESAYTTSAKMENKKKAVKDFMDQIRDFAFDKSVLSDIPRSCFIARPFEDAFARIEVVLTDRLKHLGIKAQCYHPRHESQIVVADIMRQMELAHFFIADVTGNNPNVMAEVGMMMMLPKKKLVLIKDQRDTTPWPFDIQQYNVHHYEMTNSGSELKIIGGGGSQLRPVDDMLATLVSELQKDPDFIAASEWTSD